MTSSQRTSTRPLLWYSVMVKPMNEQKFKGLLEKLISQQTLQERFGEIYIPTQTVQSIRADGKKRSQQKKLLPGYVFVQMSFGEDLFELITQIPIVLGFLGAARGKEPPAVPSEEIERLKNQIEGDESQAAQEIFDLQVGDKVVVKEGPFRSFTGEVDQVRPDKMKVKLLISVFGRQTPVEIECNKVEKVQSQDF